MYLVKYQIMSDGSITYRRYKNRTENQVRKIADRQWPTMRWISIHKEY